MKSVKCKNCGVEFDVYPSEHADGKGVYCSRECYNEARGRQTKAHLNVTVSQASRTFVEERAEAEVTTMSAVVEAALGVYRDSLRECLWCGSEFRPTELGQCMCPTCIEAERGQVEEWLERRSDGYPV